MGSSPMMKMICQAARSTLRRQDSSGVWGAGYASDLGDNPRRTSEASKGNYFRSLSAPDGVGSSMLLGVRPNIQRTTVTVALEPVVETIHLGASKVNGILDTEDGYHNVELASGRM